MKEKKRSAFTSGFSACVWACLPRSAGWLTNPCQFSLPMLSRAWKLARGESSGPLLFWASTSPWIRMYPFSTQNIWELLKDLVCKLSHSSATPTPGILVCLLFAPTAISISFSRSQQFLFLFCLFVCLFLNESSLYCPSPLPWESSKLNKIGQALCTSSSGKH